MFALAKLAGEHGANLIEILFFRQAIMVVPVLLIAATGPGLASLKTQRPLAHLRRAAVGATGMSLNFAAVGMLPLAEAQSIWFTIPLFATILAVVWLGEKVGPHRWIAVIAGFIGVLIVLQPQSGHVPLIGGGLALAASLVGAVTSILIRQIGRTEPSLTTVFWFGTISATALLIPLPWALHQHDMTTWGLLLAMGVLGSIAQISLTFALRFAPVSVVASLDYVSLLWAAALGVVLFGTWPTPSTWIGAPVIIAGGLYIIWRERKLHVAVTPPAVD